MLAWRRAAGDGLREATRETTNSGSERRPGGGAIKEKAARRRLDFWASQQQELDQGLKL